MNSVTAKSAQDLSICFKLLLSNIACPMITILKDNCSA